MIYDDELFFFFIKKAESEGLRSVLSGIFMTVLISMVLTTAAWVVYAYKNPNSASGIWLIEHRPARLVSLVTSRFFHKSTSSLSRFENPVA